MQAIRISAKSNCWSTSNRSSATFLVAASDISMCNELHTESLFNGSSRFNMKKGSLIEQTSNQTCQFFSGRCQNVCNDLLLFLTRSFSQELKMDKETSLSLSPSTFPSLSSMETQGHPMKLMGCWIRTDKRRHPLKQYRIHVPINNN